MKHAILTTTIRDNEGMIHRMGESVTVVGSLREAATERELLRAVWSDGRKAILLVSDVTEMDAHNE